MFRKITKHCLRPLFFVQPAAVSFLPVLIESIAFGFVPESGGFHVWICRMF